MRPSPGVARVAALLAVLFASGAAWAKPSDLVLTVTRTDAERFLAEYAFERPILALELGPAIDAYRATAWRMRTPNLVLERAGDAERLVHREGLPFSRAEIEISAYRAYPPDHYVPMAFFSDGGVALFLGFLLGEVAAADSFQVRTVHLRSVALGSETVLAPRSFSADRPSFAYFGAQEALDVGTARLIADPAAPPWFLSTIRETLRSTTRIYTERLGVWPREAPLVLVAARDLDSLESYSVKGGAVANQIVFTLRGKALSKESRETRSMMERLIAHEAAHLWQEVEPEARVRTDDPWIYEGGAEALAVAALVEAGRWSTSQADSFSAAAKDACREALAGEPLSKAVASGRWDSVYPCGFRLFAESPEDPFSLWKRLSASSRAEGRAFTQELFDEVVAARD